jgi:hypothetical protein
VPPLKLIWKKYELAFKILESSIKRFVVLSPWIFHKFVDKTTSNNCLCNFIKVHWTIKLKQIFLSFANHQSSKNIMAKNFNRTIETFRAYFLFGSISVHHWMQNKNLLHASRLSVNVKIYFNSFFCQNFISINQRMFLLKLAGKSKAIRKNHFVYYLPSLKTNWNISAKHWILSLEVSFCICLKIRSIVAKAEK